MSKARTALYAGLVVGASLMAGCSEKKVNRLPEVPGEDVAYIVEAIRYKTPEIFGEIGTMNDRLDNCSDMVKYVSGKLDELLKETDPAAPEPTATGATGAAATSGTVVYGHVAPSDPAVPSGTADPMDIGMWPLRTIGPLFPDRPPCNTDPKHNPKHPDFITR